MLQRSCVRLARGTTPRCRHMCLRRRIRVRSCSPSRRYSRPYALPVHPLALSLQHHVNALIAEAGPTGRYVPNPHSQLRVIPASTRPVPRRPGQPCQQTRSNHGDLVLRANPARELPPSCRLQSFFRTTSERMFLSSVRSATKRFRRAFSSRSCRSSFTSVIPILL